MDRIAVFVDSGYLFAQGSAAIGNGAKHPRTDLRLDPQIALQCLKEAADKCAPTCGLLRVYWYDGAIGGSRPTSEQALLAALDDVKLRLGFVNSHGQQKGVDSLIVTDMIELARQKAICDVLLLSGDEDVRIGVQIAQNYGVRVHLLGIHPARGSQSQQLLHEADTTSEWMADDLRKFLTIKEREIGHDTYQGASSEPKLVEGPRPLSASPKISMIEEAARQFVRELEMTAIHGVEAYWTTARGVPPDLDRRLLPTCRDKIGRDLEKSEIRAMRAEFQNQVKIRLADPSGIESRKT